VPELDPRDARIAELEAKVVALTQALEKALVRISELESQLGRNSRNSHGYLRASHNVAERALRGATLWRKISFGTDSENGSRLVERISPSSPR
jgi:predicted RNase H-like nuclease (RuvC/YqgF family)